MAQGYINDLIDVKAIEAQIKSVANLFDKFQQQIDNTAQELRAMFNDVGKTKSFKELEEVTKRYNSAVVNLTVSMEQRQKQSNMHLKLEELLSKAYENNIKVITDNISAQNKYGNATATTTEQMRKATEHVQRKTEALNADTAAQNQNAQASKAATGAYNLFYKSSEEVTNITNQLLGSFEQNTRQITQYRAQLKNLEQEQKRGNISMSEYAKETAQIKGALSELQIIQRQQVKFMNTTAGSAEELGLTVGLLRHSFRLLNEQEKESPFGKMLLANINAADKEIKNFDASIGNHQRNVGNYSMATRGLGTQLAGIAGVISGLGGKFGKVGSIITQGTLLIRQYATTQAQATRAAAAQAATTSTATVAQKAFNIALKASPILWLVTAVILAVKGVKSLIEVLNRGSKEQQLFNEIQKEAVENVKDFRSELEKNVRILQNSNSTTQQQKSALEDAKKAVEDLGFAFSNNNKLQQWYIDNAGLIIALKLEEAKAEVARKKAAEAEIELEEKSQKFQSLREKRGSWWANLWTGYDKANEKAQAANKVLKQTEQNVLGVSIALTDSAKKAGGVEIIDIKKVKEANNKLNELADKVKEYAREIKRIQIELNTDELQRQLGLVKLKYQDLFDSINEEAENSAEYRKLLEKMLQKEIEDITQAAADKDSKIKENNINDQIANMATMFEFEKQQAIANGATKEQLADLELQQQGKVFDATVGMFQMLINSSGISSERRAELIEKLNGIMIKSEQDYTNKMLSESEKRTEEAALEAQRREEAMQAAFSAIADFASELTSAITEIASGQINAQLEELNHLREQSEEWYDEQQTALDNALMTDERREEEQKRLDAERLESEKKLAAEELALRQKQAKYDKAAAITGAIISTAQAVAAAVLAGMSFVAAAPVMVPLLTALAATTGAIQIATIAAQPLPKYAKGGDNVSGLGLWGEAGAEIAVNKTQGVMYASEPTITKFDPHTRIFNAFETAKILEGERQQLMINQTNTAEPFDYERFETMLKRNKTTVNLDGRGLASIINSQGSTMRFINHSKIF
jgi:hypothetical protein